MALVTGRPDEASLYDPAERPEALRRGLLEDDQPGRMGSVRKVRSGKRLRRIRDEELHRAWGFRSLRAFVEEAAAAGQLSYGWVQARKYMRMASLPLGPLADTDFPVRTLLQLAARERRGGDVTALVALCKQGRPLPGMSAPRDRRRAKPSRLAAEAALALRRLGERLPVLFARVDGRDLSHGWAQELDERLRALVLSYAAWRGRSPAELWPERRSVERAGGEGGRDPAGSTDGKPSEDGTLGPDRGGALPAEAWHEPVVRAVVAHLGPEEPALLARHLLLVLSGRPPGELVAFVRGVGERMGEVPRAVREDLQCWLRHAAQRDLLARWPYVYNFFTAAQLPGFRAQLHALRAVDLPVSLRELLEAAWAYWPLSEPAAPGGVAGELTEAPLPEGLREADRLLRAFLSVRTEASAEAMSWAWAEAFDLKGELEHLLAEVEAGA